MAKARSLSRRSLPPPRPVDPPRTGSEAERVWTLRDPRHVSVHCAICLAGDRYELLVRGCHGDLRWYYHSADAARLGAARLRHHLLATGWIDAEHAAPLVRS